MAASQLDSLQQTFLFAAQYVEPSCALRAMTVTPVVMLRMQLMAVPMPLLIVTAPAYAAAEKVGAEVVEAACVIELPALKGREKLEGLPLFVLIEKEGE